MITVGQFGLLVLTLFYEQLNIEILFQKYSIAIIHIFPGNVWNYVLKTNICPKNAIKKTYWGDRVVVVVAYVGGGGS